ncbi:hypothetical protein H490_0103985 [Leucobacter sp. UCD-THU]|uniref:hypothetical protein n=1 Tax=Leucobacter sp. UCD-THU TaxID=1292023 RepID=UPI00036ED304|nr:hypothetical protein [Leucobacter sp. UCD-THU]EYT56038.1 hypothetical protein H490_0103985 [Leucobacter sp. UCD-THU]
MAMSRGQTPRRPEFFPRMKVRGARRRREQAQAMISFDTAIATLTEFGRGVAAAVEHVAAGFQAFAAGMVRAVLAEQQRVRDYLLSDRYQLDLIERRYRHDPIAWSNAVRDFYMARINREFDELDAASISQRLGIPLDPWQASVLAGQLTHYRTPRWDAIRRRVLQRTEPDRQKARTA